MDNNYDGHFERTIVDLFVSLRKLLYDSLFPSLYSLGYRLIVCPYTVDTMVSY